MSPFGYLALGAGVLFIWTGFANPSGGFLGELARILKNQPLAGKIGSGSNAGAITGLTGSGGGGLVGSFVGGSGSPNAAGYVWPVPGYTNISQKFHDPATGGTHPGTDIPAPVGTPVVAVADGTVVFAGLTDPTGFGALIEIAHSDGSGGTWYGHVNSWQVVAGQHVKAGQQIGTVGARGDSTGPHLHIEWHVGSINGTRVDPMSYLLGNAGDRGQIALNQAINHDAGSGLRPAA